MSDIAQKLDKVSKKVDVAWSDERARAVHAAMHRRKRRHAQLRGAVVATVAMMIVVGVAMGWKRYTRVAAFPQIAEAGVGRELHFGDGSRVMTRDDGSIARIASDSEQRVVVELTQGSARFDVVPSATRVFRVEAGPVAVESNAATFAIDAAEGAKVAVRVERGRLLVLWAMGEHVLTGGESGVFPRTDGGEAPQLREDDRGGPSPTSSAPGKATPAGTSAWRRQAQDGNFDAAFQSLRRAGPGAVRDEPGDLLLAADVARLSRHPAEAVPPLRSMLRDHRTDPRAPLAAFTLGRVLLDELGQPAQAASAFAEARKLAPGGPMAEDALAREVEAWSRSGDSNRARDAGELYVTRYPDGRRLRSVRRFGGME